MDFLPSHPCILAWPAACCTFACGLHLSTAWHCPCPGAHDVPELQDWLRRPNIHDFIHVCPLQLPRLLSCVSSLSCLCVPPCIPSPLLPSLVSTARSPLTAHVLPQGSIGAKVILTHNVNVRAGAANGCTGRLLAFNMDGDRIRSVTVKMDAPASGAAPCT